MSAQACAAHFTGRGFQRPRVCGAWHRHPPMDRPSPEPLIVPPDEDYEPAVPDHVPPGWTPEDFPEPIEPERIPEEPLVPA